MALDRYKNFVEGDILPAENVNSIDPDNLEVSDSFLLVRNNSRSVVPILGGSGVDGELLADDGELVIDLGGASFFKKDYSSISIINDGYITFSNPNDNGTLIILKCKGEFKIETSASIAIDVRLLGGIEQSPSYDGISLINKINGANGPTGGVGLNIPDEVFYLTTPLLAGAGGCRGRVQGSYNASYCGIGGRGGGGLLVECNKINLINSSINASGQNGGNKTPASGGAYSSYQAGGGGGSRTNGTNGATTGSNSNKRVAGGGGGGGSIIILGNEIVDDTTTLNVDGGTGGISDYNGGAGGDGFKYLGTLI